MTDFTHEEFSHETENHGQQINLTNDEEQSLIAMLFDGAGQTLFVDHSMGEAVDESNFFNTPELGKNGNIGSQVSTEDFVGEDYVAFVSLKKAISSAVNKGTSDTLRNLAIEWLCIPGEPNEDGLDFDLCCTALGARTNLIRVRTQYEFYNNGIILSKPLPFLAVGVPDIFDLEALSYGGELGQMAADIIWKFPSIRADHLVSAMECSVKQARSATEALEEQGIISISSGRWYFTGRNPQTMKFGSQFHWSRIRGL